MRRLWRKAHKGLIALGEAFANITVMQLVDILATLAFILAILFVVFFFG